MKTIWIGLLCLCTFLQATVAQERLESFDKTFTATRKWLVLPVKNGAPKRNVELWIDGKDQRFFDIELADGEPDWLAYLDISEWKGKEIDLRVDKRPHDSKAFDPVQQTDDDVNALPLYKEKLRGQFHFSPKRGWMNDPNGLVYFNGEYHLFFQHNPYGVNWGNMTWGHAVSKDLMHWQEVGEAIHPDRFGPMFSGGAVVDSNNTAGFGKALVIFYTAARSWGQGMAYSTDGRTFHKMETTVVHRINKDNRDPKVIWYEPTKTWVMVLWVPIDNGQNSIQFLTSKDLRNWTKSSTVLGGKGDDRYLFECPEFYELPVNGNPAEKKWVLTAANSEYAIGTFDGITFKPEEERLNGQHGRDYYASQTISNEPNGRRIEIGWWRTHTNKEGMNFNQAMSIPMELKLVRTPQGIRLSRMPVKELEMLREKTYHIGARSLKPGGSNPFTEVKDELLEIRTEFTPGSAKTVTFDIHGLPVVYNVAQQQLQIDGVKATAPLVNGKLSLIIYADRIGVEVFTADGLLFMPVNKNLDTTLPSLNVKAEGGTVKLGKTAVYGLKSIW